MSAYICDKTCILGNCVVGVDSVLLHTTLHGEDDGAAVSIGERNIIEMKCIIKNSTIKHSNIISIGSSLINCTIGSFNSIGPRCKLENCQIGDLCVLSPGLVLNNAVVPNNTSIILDSSEEWKCTTLSPELMKSNYDASDMYKKLMTEKESPQYVGRHFALR